MNPLFVASATSSADVNSNTEHKVGTINFFFDADYRVYSLSHVKCTFIFSAQSCQQTGSSISTTAKLVV